MFQSHTPKPELSSAIFQGLSSSEKGLELFQLEANGFFPVIEGQQRVQG